MYVTSNIVFSDLENGLVNVVIYAKLRPMKVPTTLGFYAFAGHFLSSFALAATYGLPLSLCNAFFCFTNRVFQEF